MKKMNMKKMISVLLAVFVILGSVAVFAADDVDPVSYLDFNVEVESGREPVILQLTDTQIIDASQQRSADRLGDSMSSYYATENMDALCFDYLRETVNAVKPDLIILTGDLVYGEFDDEGTSLIKLIEVMESFKIPWAPVFGNHDNESVLGADWQCQKLEDAQYCLFKQRSLTGNGNYTVGITQGGNLKRVFFMLDSNGCSAMSEATVNNGHSRKEVGFGADQITWYTDVATRIKNVVPDIKFSFAYHIQQEIFRTALSQYGSVDSNTIKNPVNIDTHTNKADSDFGYVGRDLKKPWDTNFAIYNAMKALGCDSHFVGHEHCNSASVMYDGTRFQYGQKSSEYDRSNYIQGDGSIIGSYSNGDGVIPIIGGTVMKMSETDGSFTDSYIYYCDNGDVEVTTNKKCEVIFKEDFEKTDFVKFTNSDGTKNRGTRVEVGSSKEETYPGSEYGVAGKYYAALSEKWLYFKAITVNEDGTEKVSRNVRAGKNTGKTDCTIEVSCDWNPYDGDASDPDTYSDALYLYERNGAGDKQSAMLGLRYLGSDSDESALTMAVTVGNASTVVETIDLRQILGNTVDKKITGIDHMYRVRFVLKPAETADENYAGRSGEYEGGDAQVYLDGVLVAEFPYTTAYNSGGYIYGLVDNRPADKNNVVLYDNITVVQYWDELNENENKDEYVNKDLLIANIRKSDYENANYTNADASGIALAATADAKEVYDNWKAKQIDVDAYNNILNMVRENSIAIENGKEMNPYLINGYFTSYNGYAINNNLSDGEKIAGVNITRFAEEGAGAGILVVASYESNGALADVVLTTIEDTDVAQYATEYITLTEKLVLPGTLDSDYKVKAFVLNGMSEIVPLAEALICTK